MRHRGEPSRELLRLAGAQDSVVTREQATGLGLSLHTLSRLTAQAHWQRLGDGVFLTHSGGPPGASLAWAGALLGGDDARLGGAAAGHAHGLVDEPPDPLEILVPHHQRRLSREHWVFVRERPGSRSPRSTGSPARTLVADTVLDLCNTASTREVEHWVTRAVQRRLTTPARLRRALDGRGRHPHRKLLADLLLDVADGAESPLELRYLRDVERRHGLPRGTRQGPSTDRSAWRDVRYDRYGLVVELDGRLGHEGEGRFRDMTRDNAALLELLVTLRFGFGDVAGSPCARRLPGRPAAAAVVAGRARSGPARGAAGPSEQNGEDLTGQSRSDLPRSWSRRAGASVTPCPGSSPPTTSPPSSAPCRVAGGGRAARPDRPARRLRRRPRPRGPRRRGGRGDEPPPRRRRALRHGPFGLWTHVAGGVTQYDVELAHRISALL